MKKTSLDRWMNRLSLLALAGTAGFLLLSWRRIPGRIPMHYNFAGEIDRWGGKWELLALYGLGWLVFLLLTAAGRSPGAWSTGVKITPENRERVCALLGNLLSTLKALLCGLFAWIAVWSALAWPLPVWFLPAALGAVSGDLIYWFVRVFRAQ